MAKLIVKTEGPLGFGESMTFERTNLREDLEKHWVGKTTSNIGIPRFSLVDGIMKLREYHHYERRDIGRIQITVNGEPAAGIFIEPDGTHSGPNGSHDVELSEEEKARVDLQVRAWMIARPEFVARQQKFFSEEPYKQLDGLTPAEAVEVLKTLGW